MANYSDLNQYPSEVEGDRVYGFRSVVQHLDNLLAIQKRELLFEPDVGSSLDPFLFKPVDAETALGIYSVITDSIRTYDTRVLISGSRSRVTPVPSDLRFDVVMAIGLLGISEEYDYNSVLYSRFKKANS